MSALKLCKEDGDSGCGELSKSRGFHLLWGVPASLVLRQGKQYNPMVKAYGEYATRRKDDRYERTRDRPAL
jgi:hypothetical protein